jgi:hypothetical protein
MDIIRNLTDRLSANRVTDELFIIKLTELLINWLTNQLID